MKILLNIISISIVIFLSNFIYSNTGLLDNDIEKCEAQLVYQFDSLINQDEVIYFGESSNFTYSQNDSCKKSIAELTKYLNPNLKLGTITKGAIHLGIYNTLIHRIKTKNNLKALIVTINLRSFGINWIESDLETNLSRASIFYKNYPPFFKKLLLSFKCYDNKENFQRKLTIKQHYKNDKFQLQNLAFTSIKEWDKSVYSIGIKDASGNRDPLKTELACHYIKNYAFVIHKDNPRIKDLDELIDFCAQKRIKVILNILPENTDKVEDLYGLNLLKLMIKNKDFIKERYSNNSIQIDNFSILRDSCFIDRNWPTEHYNFYGRFEIAKRINETLKRNIK